MTNRLIPDQDIRRFVLSTLSTINPISLSKVPQDGLATYDVLSLISRPTAVSAINNHWSHQRQITALEQLTIASVTHTDLGEIDGLVGPRTTFALELYQNAMREITLALPDGPHLVLEPKFPRQKDAHAFFGAAGSPTCQTPYVSRYPLRMDGSLSSTSKVPTSLLAGPNRPADLKSVPIVRKFALHVKLHSSYSKIQADILARYGVAKIEELGIDQFAGSYNYRPMRGGTSLSMHAYGAAIDLDAQRNTLRETADTARFATAPYKPLIDIHYDHGWINLGRERNFDWMHFQALGL